VRWSYLQEFSTSTACIPLFEGFEIYWDGATTGCGGRLTSPEGSISSPNYPQVILTIKRRKPCPMFDVGSHNMQAFVHLGTLNDYDF
jgi:hypothetical protein